jgi:succinoglycan biosynthesis protein ExoW
MAGPVRRVAVIIPYYQREQGLLSRTVRSVVQQANVSGIEIDLLIVDDESPWPPESELSDFRDTRSVRIRIIRQKNGGSAVARNTALDNLDASTDCVAYLDSDDYWSPDHLSRGIAALSAGADFYFADIHYLDEAVTRFERGGFPSKSELSPLLPDHDIWRFTGDTICTVLQGYVGTSTVVYRHPQFAQFRFPQRQRTFVDQPVWARIGSVARAIAISTRCECYMGRGVNIYADQKFGTEKALRRFLDEINYRKILPGEVPMSEAARAMHETRLEQARTGLALEILHQMARCNLRLPVLALRRYPEMLPYVLVALRNILRTRTRKVDHAR